MRLIHYPAILGLAALLSLPAALAGDVVDIGSRRELFVDHLLVDRLVGASLRLGTPLPGGWPSASTIPWKTTRPFTPPSSRTATSTACTTGVRSSRGKPPATPRAATGSIGRSRTWDWSPSTAPLETT